jgi:hypothetical protein
MNCHDHVQCVALHGNINCQLHDPLKICDNFVLFVIKLCWTVSSVYLNLKLYDVSEPEFAFGFRNKNGNDSIQFGPLLLILITLHLRSSGQYILCYCHMSDVGDRDAGHN